MAALRARGLPAALACLLALGAAACGGTEISSDEVPVAPPKLTVPREGPAAEDPLAETTPTTPQDATSTDEAPPSTTTTTTPAPAPGTTPQTGGEQAPQATTPQDSPENDQPPAEGSPAQRFENFCAQNPGAC